MGFGAESDKFDKSGPKHLTEIEINWKNPNHQRQVVASLVKAAYVLENDRDQHRMDNKAFAPQWWESFNFQLLRSLSDNDSSIFGAIFKLKSPPPEAPRYIFAFRGTATQQDMVLDLNLVFHSQDMTYRFNTAVREVRKLVSEFGPSSVWLAGHSLGAAVALVGAWEMAEKGDSLETFLFNPPFNSSVTVADFYPSWLQPLARFGRYGRSLIKAGIATVWKDEKDSSSSIRMSGWKPKLFVNPGDVICRGYIGYFDHKEWMEENGNGNIEREATKVSYTGLLWKMAGKESKPYHLLSSADLIINDNKAPDRIEAHALRQWWKEGSNPVCKSYNYM